MSVRLSATCPRCGPVTIHPGDVLLVVCNLAPLSHYSFRCPRCGDKVEKPADDLSLGLLVEAGVKPLAWHVPTEWAEPKLGEPLTIDDLLDFTNALARTEFVAAGVTG